MILHGNEIVRKHGHAFVSHLCCVRTTVDVSADLDRYLLVISVGEGGRGGEGRGEQLLSLACRRNLLKRKQDDIQICACAKGATNEM